ncbi:MAG: DUF2127 domain-containing protein [Acidobacteria bacterium]|jgi:uncharacterized membrane protein (DUF2068 family)|nr:MAG: DUF2127 domain-containing protein [Acidobacteriota bacterium]
MEISSDLKTTDTKHKNDPGHKKGLRTVATIEFLKGIGGVLLGVGFLSLVHKDVWDITARVMEFLHINPDRHWAQVILDRADQVTDHQLLMVAAGFFAYSTLRFIEAYGLWKTRIWAEWLAILSGLLYLPFELHELLRKATPLKWALLVINLALVSYVAYVRFSAKRLERQVRAQEEAR